MTSGADFEFVSLLRQRCGFEEFGNGEPYTVILNIVTLVERK